MNSDNKTINEYVWHSIQLPMFIPVSGISSGIRADVSEVVVNYSDYHVQFNNAVSMISQFLEYVR